VAKRVPTGGHVSPQPRVEGSAHAPFSRVGPPGCGGGRGSAVGGPGRAGSCNEIGDGDRFVAMWTRTSGTDATAESAAIGAILFTEVARRTGGALVHRAWSWRALGDRRQWRGASAPPGSLPTHPIAEALSTVPPELGATHSAVHRLAIVTQRHLRHLAGGCAGVAPTPSSHGPGSIRHVEVHACAPLSFAMSPQT
jgi:hypothetical protein